MYNERESLTSRHKIKTLKSINQILQTFCITTHVCVRVRMWLSCVWSVCITVNGDMQVDILSLKKILQNEELTYIAALKS